MKMKTKISTYFYSMLVLGFVLMVHTGCNKNQETEYNPAGTGALTTLDRNIVPDNVPVTPTVLINDPANFVRYGYGKWHWGPGIPCQKRVDLMPSGYQYTAAKQASKLLRFFTITDIHITDKESPAQAIYFSTSPYAGNNQISIYSPLMMYTTQVFNSMVQTLNEIHKKNPFDLGLSLGDMANSMQHNELRWFIDILDGKLIKPYSGGVKDPVPGPGNDYQDEFKAAGLDPSIPWYATLGNHDHFWLGSKVINNTIRQSMIGTNILQMGHLFTDPDAFNKNTYSAGTFDGSTPYGTIIGSGVTAEIQPIPKVTADPDRYPITISDFMNEFSNSSTFPKGHGFIQADPKNQFGASYSFEPKANLPIKIIVLDDTQSETDPLPAELIYGHGELNNGRLEWLKAQLQAGQDDGLLMIIAAHVPIGVAAKGSPMSWLPAEGYTSERDLIGQLQSYPNLILMLAGHRHLNTITPFSSVIPGHPENSFWQVETCSLREFPSQARTIDIVSNSDSTISIIAINVDENIAEGSMASIGRTYEIASAQIYGMNGTAFPTGLNIYNAELVKPLSQAMKVKIANYRAGK